MFQDLLRDTRKKSYSPLKLVKTYVLRWGVRERYWRVNARNVVSILQEESLCEGKADRLVLDATKLQVICIIIFSAGRHYLGMAKVKSHACLVLNLAAPCVRW